MLETATTGFDPSIAVNVWSAGFMDGVNPCNFAAALIFIIYLSMFGFSVKRIVSLGGLYILCAGSVYYSSLTGSWDALLTTPGFLATARTLHLMMAVGFILMSVFELIDWSSCRKGHSVTHARLRLPAYFTEKTDGHEHLAMSMGQVIGSITVAVLFAMIATMAALTYPQSKLIFIVHSYWLSVGSDKWFSHQLFFLYTAAMMTWMIVAWIKVWWLCFKRKKSLRTVLFYKAVLSALFLSTGIGLGLYYL